MESTVKEPLLPADGAYASQTQGNELPPPQGREPREFILYRDSEASALEQGLNASHIGVKQHKIPIHMSWQNLDVTLNQQHGCLERAKRKTSEPTQKKILNSQSGEVGPSRMLAIMGSSGAGKSTLLSALTMRLQAQKSSAVKTRGSVLINGQPFTSIDFQRCSAFIMQNDYLQETLTVRETILFSARMRLKGSDEKKQRRTDKLIRMLKLERCQNTLIGGYYLKGVSGGERKRASIGVELVNNPNLILLDEPTSGLDSFTAYVIVQILRDLSVRYNKTVIFTIHQPSSEIFAILDRLLLLAEGHAVYDGQASDIVQYMRFASQLHDPNEKFNLPTYCNPADYMMENLTSANTFFKREYFEQYTGVKALKVDSNVTPSMVAAGQELAKGANSGVPQSQIMRGLTRNEYTNSFWYETKYILKRSAVSFTRDPIVLYGRLFAMAFMCFLIDILWWRKAGDVPAMPVQQSELGQFFSNTQGLQFFMLFSLFCNINVTLVLCFPLERLTYLKENGSGMYRTGSYFVGRMLLEIPYILIAPIIMNLLIYPFAHMQWNTFWNECGILILLSLVTLGSGLLVGTIFRDPGLSVIMSSLYMVPFFMFSGFFNNFNMTPAALRWTQYISPFRFCFEAMMRNQYNDIHFSVYQEDGTIVPLDPYKFLGFTIGYTNCLLALAAFAIGFALLALLALWRGKKTLV